MAAGRIWRIGVVPLLPLLPFLRPLLTLLLKLLLKLLMGSEIILPINKAINTCEACKLPVFKKPAATVAALKIPPNIELATARDSGGKYSLKLEDLNKLSDKSKKPISFKKEKNKNIGIAIRNILFTTK